MALVIKTIIFIGLIVVCASAYPQRLITGKVKELKSGNTVEGVTIAIFKGTSVATTNENGYFQLTVHNDDSLLITHKDYKTGLIAIPTANIFSILVEPHQNYPVYLEGEASLYEFLLN